MAWKRFCLWVLLGGLLAVCACTGQGPVPVKPKGGFKAPANTLTGAGSSFVYPMLSKWASVYNQKTRVRVNYQSIGSGGGIRQFSSKIVDFGATDAPMTEEELKAAGAGVLHIPVIVGAVAVTYNLPGMKQPLRLSGPALAGVFMGTVRKWNDPVVARDNAGATLPDAPIVVVHRSDGSGTTFIFSDWLSKVSPEWKQKLGAGKSLNWPVGIGGKGNEGVAALIQRTPNAIGYVEQLYANRNKMPTAQLKNREGEYVAPSVESATATGAGVSQVPEDLRMSITDAPGKQAYPLAGMSWVLARSKMDDPARAKTLREFLLWTLGDQAQAMAAPLGYSKLAPNLLEKARAMARQIK